MGGGRRRSGGKAQPQGPGGCRGGGQGLGRTAPRPRLRRRGQAGAGPARPPGTPRAAARAGARDGADDAAILTMWGSVLAFALVAALLTITPGIDTALVIRNTLQGGRATGLRTSLGICTGLIVWGLLSALGVTAVVTASRVAYAVLRFAGAAYLVFLGVRTLLLARRSAGRRARDCVAAQPCSLQDGDAQQPAQSQGRRVLRDPAAAVHPRRCVGAGHERAAGRRPLRRGRHLAVAADPGCAPRQPGDAPRRGPAHAGAAHRARADRLRGARRAGARLSGQLSRWETSSMSSAPITRRPWASR